MPFGSTVARVKQQFFYTSIFPNSSMADNWIAPTDTLGNKQGEEIVVNFTIFGRPFIGLNGGPQFPHSEAVSFQIPCGVK
jgi:predicted 3-demethylubiquinone-9 3-methyltransferase (glyoxalase superfamily)